MNGTGLGRTALPAAAMTGSADVGGRKPLEAFVCPSCHGTLESFDESWRCSAEDLRFGMENGIPTFILPHRRSALEGFLESYRRVRASERWGSSSAEYYRGLPYHDRTGNHDSVWRIRARTFDCFLAHLARNRSAHSGLVLDAGAGNCWLSARLAERGFDVAALDINDDPQDGLGALALVSPALRSNIVPVRAEFDALPFGSEMFDIEVLNASLHYSSDVMHTLEGLLTVLKSGGMLYVLDSPVYGTQEAGEQMVRERNTRFREQFGIMPLEEPSAGFITSDIVRQIQGRFRVELLDPCYGLRWALRPHAARLLRRREPALFQIIVVHKD
jgi:SAM-dependent methyltransferase